MNKTLGLGFAALRAYYTLDEARLVSLERSTEAMLKNVKLG